jgi:hypothetical protein
MTENERPRTNKPLHGEERPKWLSLAATIGILVLVIVLFMVITYVQQHT